MLVKPHVSPASFTSQYHDRYLISKGYSRLIPSRLLNEVNMSVVKRTYATLASIGFLYSQQSCTDEKNMHAFKFHIQGITQGKADVTLDFSESPLSKEDIKNVQERIELAIEEKQLFCIKTCYLGPSNYIQQRLQNIIEELVKDPRTSVQTKELGKVHTTLLSCLIFRVFTDCGKIEWKLSLDFTNSPLNQYEIQYVIWNTFYIPGCMVEFTLTKLNFTNSAVNIYELIGGGTNKQYPEIQGKHVGSFLKQSITELNLNSCIIGPEILVHLGQFRKLTTLSLFQCIQNKQNAIRPVDMIKALGNCTHLKNVRIEEWQFKKEEDKKEE